MKSAITSGKGGISNLHPVVYDTGTPCAQCFSGRWRFNPLGGLRIGRNTPPIPESVNVSKFHYLRRFGLNRN